MTFLNRITGRTALSPAHHDQAQTLSGWTEGGGAAGSPASHEPASLRPAEIVALEHFSEVEVQLTEEDRAFWCFMDPANSASFTPKLLGELSRVRALMARLFDEYADPRERPFDYFVLGSHSTGVFNLGGDLNLFRQKIEQHDVASLRAYAHACVEVGYANYSGHGQRVVTIALVQGDALGGGFEGALSCDLIIAERQAKFGLPEILFNLFPGMGAYSFLARRVGGQKAEEMIMSGTMYTAEELHRLGIVDVLAETGCGQEAVKAYIAANSTRHNVHSAIYQVRRRVNAVTLDELRDVTDLWVEAAMRLTAADLRKMGRLAAAQDRSRQRRGVGMMLAAE